MHWRAAIRSDLPAITAFLTRHVEYAMFPLTNLRDHGLDGTAPRAMQFWINGDDKIENLFGQSREGVAFPIIPDATPDLLSALAALLKSRPILGVIGQSGQVRMCRKVFGLANAVAGHDVDESAYALSLNALECPPLDGYTLDPITPADRGLLIGWRSAYQVEVLSAPEKRARALATQDIDTFITRDSHRLLRLAGLPVAMTGFNARSEHAVQIGGVYTPPDQRNHGHARRAVALHLLEVRENGVKQAFLCAANQAAARAYIALGFRQWGKFSMIFFAEREEIG